LKQYPEIELRWNEVGLSFQVQFVKLNYKLEENDSKTQNSTDQKTDQKGEATKVKVITLLKDNPKLTKADLMKILNKSRGTINEHIINLKNEGKLQRVGGRKEGYWEVIQMRKFENS